MTETSGVCRIRKAAVVQTIAHISVRCEGVAGVLAVDASAAVRVSEITRLVLDFSRVTFMDSSGIGLVMGRYKLMTERGGKCVVADPPAYISRVKRISGINRLCEIVHIQRESAEAESPQAEPSGERGVKI